MKNSNIFRGKRIDNGEWIEGYLVVAEKDIPLILQSKSYAFLPDGANVICANCYRVAADTLCRCAGICDQNGKMLFTGDTVDFFDQVGTVTSECGAFGITFQENIDWNKIATAIPEYTGCDNRLYACQHDNFISFWEITWNFNAEPDDLELPFVIRKNKTE